MTSRIGISLGSLAACLVLGLLGTSTCHGSGDGSFVGGLGGSAGEKSSSPNDTGGRPGGGDAGASSSGGSGAGGSKNGSTPCLDADDCGGSRPVCHPDRRTCVECVVADDCEGAALCQGNACKQTSACSNSLQCDPGLVCVKDAPEDSEGLCLECGTAADCGDDGVCVDFTCRTACASDAQCTPMGLLCDLNNGYCTECVDASACGDNEFCDAGECAPQVCTPGATSCVGEGVATCNALGSGFGPPQGCGDYPCTVQDGVAACSFPPTNAPPNAVNTNGDFSAGGTGWTVEPAGGGGTKVPANPTGGRVCANGESFLLGWPADPADAALLEGGQSYTLRVRAETTGAGSNSLILKVGRPVAPFTDYLVEEYTQISGTANITESFVAPSSVNAGIALTLSAFAGVELCVTDIWLVRNNDDG